MLACLNHDYSVKWTNWFCVIVHEPLVQVSHPAKVPARERIPLFVPDSQLAYLPDIGHLNLGHQQRCKCFTQFNIIKITVALKNIWTLINITALEIVNFAKFVSTIMTFINWILKCTNMFWDRCLFIEGDTKIKRQADIQYTCHTVPVQNCQICSRVSSHRSCSFLRTPAEKPVHRCRHL